jgi:hypothetical protein
MKIVPLVPHSSTGEGNTKTSPSVKKKQISPSKDWFFTLNNYKEEDLNQFRSIVPEVCDKACIYFEEGESGTPHLQGNLKLTNKGRPASIFNWTKSIHWEKTRFPKKANIYCQKDGKPFLTYGVQDSEVRTIEKEDFYPWQEEIYNMVQVEPDDRTIIWAVGDKGVGKTQFLKHLVKYNGACIVGGAERHMLKIVYDNQDTTNLFVINLTANQSNKQTNDLFSAIEAIKDGLSCSHFGTKGTGGIFMNSPHLIIMANKLPSRDIDINDIDEKRFKILKINNYKEENLAYLSDSNDEE